jgi:uncharacterized protein (DUF2336 family)
MNFFKKMLPRKQRLEADERALAERGTEKERMTLAKDERTSQEILYYLADKDPSTGVRKAAAGNTSMPLQAAPILAKDRDQDVRMIIANRLVKILPSLSEDKYSQLYAFAVQSLGMLALDEVLKIRKALSETLKDHAFTPPAIAAQLARDLEREVSEPILRFCAALSDDDLVDILKTHPANWAAEAIAGRNTVSSRVCEAVINTGNVLAGKILISNEGAIITETLLETIISRAQEYPECHKPLAGRKSLPPLMARKLAAYVDKSVRNMLLERTDLDRYAIAEITEIIKRRIDYEEDKKRNFDKSDPVKRAKKLFAHGDLSEETLNDAIAMGDRLFVVNALALRAQAKTKDIEKVFDVKAPKSICAICWKAGFSMRLALKLQQTFGAVKSHALIYPRGGMDYPLTEEELRWQLEVIGINPKR